MTNTYDIIGNLTRETPDILTGTSSGERTGTSSGTSTGTSSGTSTGTSSGTSSGTSTGETKGEIPDILTGTSTGETLDILTGTSSGETPNETPNEMIGDTTDNASDDSSSFTSDFTSGYSTDDDDDEELFKITCPNFIVYPVPLKRSINVIEELPKTSDDIAHIVLSKNDVKNHVAIDLRDFSPINIKSIRHTLNDKLLCAPNFRLFWIASLYDPNNKNDKEIFNRALKIYYELSEDTVDSPQSMLSDDGKLRETYINTYCQIVEKRFEDRLKILRYLVKRYDKLVFISNRFKLIEFINRDSFKNFIDNKINTIKTIKEPVYYEYLIIKLIMGK